MQRGLREYVAQRGFGFRSGLRSSLLLLGVALLLVGCRTTGSAGGGSAAVAHGRMLAERLVAWRAEYDLPALGVAILRPDGTLTYTAAGVREVGSPQRVTSEDLFHLGSCSKAMTATMIASLVEDGTLRWDSTLGEVFPDLASEMHPGFRPVTLWHLLSHLAGLPDDRSDPATQMRIEAGGGTDAEKRLAILRVRTAAAPQTEPGSTYCYSNAGYQIAAVMVERVTGRSYEELMQERVFEPLGMTTAGFGAPGSAERIGSADRIDQPRGHRLVQGRLVAVPPGPFADNPRFTVPSGGIHCTLSDWARFARAHLQGARGTGGLLTTETFARLHRPSAGAYAGGWLVTRDAAGDLVLSHHGSNTMWYAVIELVPDRNAAVMAVTNRAGGVTTDGMMAIVESLKNEFVSTD